MSSISNSTTPAGIVILTTSPTLFPNNPLPIGDSTEILD